MSLLTFDIFNDILWIYIKKGFMMTATISSWGNSQGLRFPKDIMKTLHLTVGDKMNIVVENQTIILKPIKKPREKLDINALVADMPNDYKAHELFDDKFGLEEW